MNVVNLHSSCTMILLGILASTTIIGLTSSTPLSSYERRDLSADRPKLFLLVDQRIPELENEMLDSGSDPNAAARRTKRIGSLSIVNSLDVLRQRVLLELARRKALQDQRQIDANRRFLETIGKRSVPEYGPDVDRVAAMSQRQQQRAGSHDQSTASDRATSKSQDWFEESDPVFRESQDDQMTRVQANELRLL
ncbi:diuretic hormone 44 [Odontomachus brunneus]|uniref:diuretic hormone 44 n=1 Tax=Odontomachus brunneus TaxID=486640 RepID=UPI0013F260D5|nr:diuretic hormone 44 [Odontomachus brunneus]XP_032663100.1 diuretic hormone 44 [Odontomachus brunneus]XP_032663101.1 diuretic hormone 44 [Odontomachus brunneus]XP_032663102.1 diuretic hormone 44 [Odontomachus brunneus]XP_032663103.1 diuretic hormone 44 [Odontomachus brunneus]XP_032663104.1 diuretic hormone 44 [Odontomachus brunneus]XP_032663105.1 diuretic hormone 44 [Odontomachus brunneus]XP_032663106.1 diuretic hormone 44 [Odontomachus brunneus]